MNARVKPNTRGAWFTAESGQMLRHSPGATKKISGSTGTMTLKKTNNPPAGLTNSPMTSAT